MPQLADRSETNRFIGLLAGESGSGKSVAAASFPKPIHFDDFDGRISGVQGAKWIDTKGIDYDYYPPKQSGLIPKLNARLQSMLNAAALIPAVMQLPTTHVADSLTNMTYAFLCQALPLTHGSGDRGRWIGGKDPKDAIAMAGPEDYGLEAQATYDYIAFLKSLPIPNVIVSAHIIDRYGKADPNNPYSENVVIGEKLSIRDKISENIKSHFDHIFKFERIAEGSERFYVTFKGGIARTSFSWLPFGRQDITGKDFYKFMMSFKPAPQESSK
jgi:AAA domain-containing protein